MNRPLGSVMPFCSLDTQAWCSLPTTPVRKRTELSVICCQQAPRMKLLQPFLRRTSSLSSSLPGRPHQLRNASSLLAPGQQSLRNEYYALRHGWSKANEAGIIVSRIDSGARLEYGAFSVWEGAFQVSRRWRTVGLHAVEQTREGQTTSYRAGLHATGREQASAAGDAFKAIVQTRPVTILSSDFSRTFETAKLVAAAVGGVDVEAEPALRERDFGDFELGPNTAYEAVWEQDAIDATHTAWGVEAAAVVLSRAAGAVRRVEESAREGHAVLLVSHGDCLQILQTAFAGVDVSAHRSLPHLETCELRRLELSGV